MNLEMIPAISPLVFKLLSHPQEAVRKKAVVAVHKFFKIVPETVLDHKDQIRKVLCDPDPSVMGASLHVLCEAHSHSLLLLDSRADRKSSPSCEQRPCAFLREHSEADH